MKLKSVGFSNWYARIRREEELHECTACGGKAKGVNTYRCLDCGGDGETRCDCCGHVKDCEDCGGEGEITVSFTCGRCDGLGKLLPVNGQLMSLERAYEQMKDRERRLAALWQVEVV